MAANVPAVGPRRMPVRQARWDNVKPYMFAEDGDWLELELDVPQDLKDSGMDRRRLRRLFRAAQDIRELLLDIQAFATATGRTPTAVLMELGYPRNVYSRWKSGRVWIHISDYSGLLHEVPRRDPGPDPDR